MYPVVARWFRKQPRIGTRRVEWGKTNQRGKMGQFVNLLITSNMHQLNLLLVFTESASMYYYLLRPIQQWLLHMLQLQQRFYLRPIFS